MAELGRKGGRARGDNVVCYIYHAVPVKHCRETPARACAGAACLLFEPIEGGIFLFDPGDFLSFLFSFFVGEFRTHTIIR